MFAKWSHRYVEIENSEEVDDEEDMYCKRRQSEERVLHNINDSLNTSTKRVTASQTYSSLFATIASLLLLALCLLCIVVVFNNKYHLNSHSFVSHKLTLNDSNVEITLSPFERAVSVETKCGTVVGNVEESAFAFKVYNMFT